MVIDVKLVQPKKAFVSILFTVDGIRVFLHPTVNELVAVSITALQFSLESKVGFVGSTFIETKPLQPSNASQLIYVTEFGMVIDVKPVHRENAY